MGIMFPKDDNSSRLKSDGGLSMTPLLSSPHRRPTPLFHHLHSPFFSASGSGTPPTSHRGSYGESDGLGIEWNF